MTFPVTSSTSPFPNNTITQKAQIMKKILVALLAAVALILVGTVPANARAVGPLKYPVTVTYDIGAYPDATNTYTVTNTGKTDYVGLIVEFTDSQTRAVLGTTTLDLASGASTTFDSPYGRNSNEVVSLYVSPDGNFITMVGTGNARPYDSLGGNQYIDIDTGQTLTKGQLK